MTNQYRLVKRSLMSQCGITVAPHAYIYRISDIVLIPVGIWSGEIIPWPVRR